MEEKLAATTSCKVSVILRIFSKTEKSISFELLAYCVEGKNWSNYDLKSR